MIKKPYIVTTKASLEEQDEFGDKLDNRMINPLVFLANQGVEDGIDDECMGEINDFTFVTFIDPDYIERIKKFFQEGGLIIEINDFDEYFLNNELSLIKVDDGFNERIEEYIINKFSINDILDKGILTEFEQEVLNKKSQII